MEKKKKKESSGNGRSTIWLHLLLAASPPSAYFVSRLIYGWDLVSHPSQALFLLLVVEAPVVIGAYSWLRRDRRHCSFLVAAGRGLLALPIGALLNSFGAIVLGAPVGIKYWISTIYWSLLMSLLTFVPAVCVFGSSKTDWQTVLSVSKLSESVDCMISMPAHGAVIGAWLGAWPMPLDWEKPWQEWPICVTYGAIAGYLFGLASSMYIVLFRRRAIRAKGD
ncbi:phosphatidylinositol-glycan biosynthesis class F protein [Iris pallida]|uniref:Phosphatidylinositol-glycan biosynthesis class F protein n=1 Tax=Iris pallida TaxID=29817 RepID=A0AAX6I106_IRIPA|nr:phosphatidylinositol-glycan biosynthesis class F protein [Iris pallida]